MSNLKKKHNFINFLSFNYTMNILHILVESIFCHCFSCSITSSGLNFAGKSKKLFNGNVFNLFSIKSSMFNRKVVGHLERVNSGFQRIFNQQNCWVWITLTTTDCGCPLGSGRVVNCFYGFAESFKDWQNLRASWWRGKVSLCVLNLQSNFWLICDWFRLTSDKWRNKKSPA